MPNWCENEIRFDNIEDKEKFEQAFVRNSEDSSDDTSQEIDLNLISKMPDKISEDERYKFVEDNWGTKWSPDILQIEDDFISFNSAWSPPDKAMLKASEILGIRIKILYGETGNSFAGKEVYNCGKIEESIQLDELYDKKQVEAIEDEELREFAEYVWCFTDDDEDEEN